MRRQAATWTMIALSAMCVSLVQDAKGDHSKPEAARSPQQLSHIVVKFRPGTAGPDRILLHRETGFQVDRTIDQLDMHVVRIPPGKTAEEVIARYQRHPLVEFAEPDHIFVPAREPNDPWYDDPIVPQWHFSVIGAPAAWDLTTGSADVIIAVLDSGIYAQHEDLSSRVIPGWNVLDQNSDTSPVDGHGTSVAGAVGAASDNAIGVAAITWGCKIMPIRVSNSFGWTNASVIADGIVWATDHGARIANISFEGPVDATFSAAAQYLHDRGGVVVKSAGNSGTFDPSADNPYVLQVSATDADDLVPSWSVTGNNVDLSAPGVRISTTTITGGYGAATGTSFSAPIVAGVAALVMSINPALSGAEVQDILKRSADDLGAAGWDSSYGWGRVNAERAVTKAAGALPPEPDTTPPSVTLTEPANGQVVSGVVTVSASANDNIGVSQVELYCDGELISADGTPPHIWWVDTTNLPDGPHAFQAVAFDAAGNSAESAVVTVTIDNAEPCDCPADCSAPASMEFPSSTCDDGLDNDCDGVVDCDDPDCGSAAACVVLSCNFDGVCDVGENCDICPNDCLVGSGASCGNGVCETGNGEDCVSCPADCAGKQDGKPSRRFCCGDGDGGNPVDCTDNRCRADGFVCTDRYVADSCCGDAVCDGAETGCNCPVDCGSPPLREVLNSTCGDGVDNDCDGLSDCNDPDCADDMSCPACDNDGFCEPREDCKTCPFDCAGEPRGRRLNRFCCGNGVLELAEGDGSVCDGNP